MQIKMMGSWMILLVKGTKSVQHVMKAEPVFLFKPELLFCFSNGMSKSRGDMFSPTRTVQSHLANQVCLFSRVTQWQPRTFRPALGSKWMERSRKSQKKMAGTWLRLQKEQDSLSFLLCWPQTITLDHFNSSSRSTAWQDPSSPLRLCSNHKIPVFSHPQRRILGHSEPTVCRGAGRGRR